jgi:hypothetical protein
MSETASTEKLKAGVGMPQQLYLHEFGSKVWDAFGSLPYLVGSVLTCKAWRDVDIRFTFAYQHVCEVEVHEHAPCNHIVVMLRDGAILDPLCDEPKRITDYFSVLNVMGLVKVGT